MSGMQTLEANIARFEQARDELKEMVAEAHATLKNLKAERREIEKLLAEGAEKIVDGEINRVMTRELATLSPAIEKKVHQVYDNVQVQVDKILAICLGTDVHSKRLKGAVNHADLRPILAAQLRQWILQVLTEQTSEYMEQIANGSISPEEVQSRITGAFGKPD